MEFKRAGPLRLIHAFRNSMDGMEEALRTERAFRLELLLALVLVPVAFLLTPNAVERALLAGSVILVLVVELLNSSIETVVDRISLERHALSKRAKDIGSAAVLLSLVLAGTVWAIVLAPRFA